MSDKWWRKSQEALGDLNHWSEDCKIKCNAVKCARAKRKMKEAIIIFQKQNWRDNLNNGKIMQSYLKKSVELNEGKVLRVTFTDMRKNRQPLASFV